MLARNLRLVPSDPSGDDPPGESAGRQDRDPKREALPYVIELWEENSSLDVVIGQLADPSLAWASYYTALRTYVGRKIVLRHNARILARSVFPD